MRRDYIPQRRSSGRNSSSRNTKRMTDTIEAAISVLVLIKFMLVVIVALLIHYGIKSIVFTSNLGENYNIDVTFISVKTIIFTSIFDLFILIGTAKIMQIIARKIS